MKKILIAVLVIGALCIVSHYEHNYTKKGCRVIQVNDGYVTAEDRCGLAWDFKGNGFKVGDMVDLKMYDNRTGNYIVDDVVKDVVHKGNTSIVLRAGK